MADKEVEEDLIDVSLKTMPSSLIAGYNLWSWETPYNQLRTSIISECTVNIFKVLLNEIGPVRALE